MTPTEFVKRYYPLTKKICAQHGIDALGCLAQAALETGWGASHPGGVWFGIKKWRKSPAATTTLTYEVVNGKRVSGPAAFSQDDENGDGQVTYEEACHGYCHFIMGNSRYKEALQHPNEWRAYVREIFQAGYATDPEYLSKLYQIGQLIEHIIYKEGIA